MLCQPVRRDSLRLLLQARLLWAKNLGTRPDSESLARLELMLCQPVRRDSLRLLLQARSKMAV
jgi:hypothetical protein